MNDIISKWWPWPEKRDWLQRTRSKVEEDHSELKDELEEFVKSFPKLSTNLDEILEFSAGRVEYLESVAFKRAGIERTPSESTFKATGDLFSTDKGVEICRVMLLISDLVQRQYVDSVQRDVGANDLQIEKRRGLSKRLEKINNALNDIVIEATPL